MEFRADAGIQEAEFTEMSIWWLLIVFILFRTVYSLQQLKWKMIRQSFVQSQQSLTQESESGRLHCARNWWMQKEMWLLQMKCQWRSRNILNRNISRKCMYQIQIVGMRRIHTCILIVRISKKMIPWLMRKQEPSEFVNFSWIQNTDWEWMEKL